MNKTYNRFILNKKSRKKNFKIKINKKSFKNKISFEGRIFKLSVKKNVWNWRFNKFNKDLMIYSKYINIKFHRFKNKIYIHNTLNKLERKNNYEIFKRIRLVNIYTLRAIKTDYKSISKKEGRISEYF